MRRVSLYVLVWTLALGFILASQAEAAQQDLTEQEKYVLQQVATGQWAHLKLKFGNKEENRRLSARFLEDLLTGAYKAHRKGILIAHAIINEPLDLQFAQIPHNTFLVACQFKEKVLLGSTVFERFLCIEGSNFEQEASFVGVKVKQSLACNKCTFKGPVDFIHADIGQDFRADGAQFLSQEHKASFNGMKVGQAAFFDQAVFHGPVDFAKADIGGRFWAIGAKFLSKKHRAEFNSMRIDGMAFFHKVIFHGNVNLRYGTYLDLYLKGTTEIKQEGPEGLVNLYLDGVVIQRKLLIEDFNLAALEARHFQVKGPANFINLTIKNFANFQNARIEDLNFENVKWPQEQEGLKLSGLTYTSLSVDGPDNFRGLLGLVERSAFSSQNYVQLGEYCKHSGHENWANEVFISMKDRELAQMGWYNPGRWLIQVFWGWLAGYGRAPLRIFWLSLAIVFLGAVLFNPDYLDEDKRPQHGNKSRRLLLRFLISLDQFLPAVNMQLAEHWRAKDRPFPIWLYFTVEQVLGWIIIPIALAAIYTQIK